MSTTVAGEDWQVERDGDRLSVAGRIDFGSARGLLDAVAPSLADGSTRCIEFTGVTHSNSAGLALMIEWTALARRAGHELRFESVPESLKALARVSQVDELLQLQAA